MSTPKINATMLSRDPVADRTLDLRRRFNFFLEHAGGIVGRHAEGALALARAERYAEEHGWTFTWEDDPDADTSWCTECTTASDGHDHLMYGCILKDEHGTVLGSLWGIDGDPCPHGGGVVMGYGRVVQAELASEALHDIQRREQEDRDATRYMAL